MLGAGLRGRRRVALERARGAAQAPHRAVEATPGDLELRRTAALEPQSAQGPPERGLLPGELAEPAGQAPPAPGVETRRPPAPGEPGPGRLGLLQGEDRGVGGVEQLVPGDVVVAEGLPGLGDPLPHPAQPGEAPLHRRRPGPLDEEAPVQVVEEEKLDRGRVGDLQAHVVDRTELPVAARGLGAGDPEEHLPEGAVEARALRVTAPGLLGRPGEGEPGVALEVVVPAVAPVRAQQPAGAEAARRLGPARDVQLRVLDAREQAVPARGARAHPEVEPRVPEDPDPLVVALRLVPPVEEQQVPVDLAHDLRVLVHHVAPDEGALAVGPGQVAHLANVVQEEAAAAEAPGAVLRAAPAQVPGLVAVRVEEPRAEVGQVLAEEVAQQLVAARIRRREGPAAVALVQVPVALEGEDPLHVAQGLEAGHELHVAGRRVGVELAQLLGAEGRGARADLGVAPEAEGVLGVEHQHVELEPDAQVQELADAGDGGNLAPGDVEHEPALRQERRVLDGAGRHPAVGADHLGQGLHAVAQARRAGRAQRDALGGHIEPIALSALALAVELHARTQVRRVGVGLDGKGEPAALRHHALEGAGRGEVRVPGRGGQHQGQVVAEAEAPGSASRAPRLGQQRRQPGRHPAQHRGARRKSARSGSSREREGRGSRAGRQRRTGECESFR